MILGFMNGLSNIFHDSEFWELVGEILGVLVIAAGAIIGLIIVAAVVSVLWERMK